MTMRSIRHRSLSRLSPQCRPNHGENAPSAASPTSLEDRTATAPPRRGPSPGALRTPTRPPGRVRRLIWIASPQRSVPGPVILSKSQKRHRMLSSRSCGVATSVTRSAKFPFMTTTSPRATILSPTTRSTGSDTCRSSSTTSPGPSSRTSRRVISRDPNLKVASSSMSHSNPIPASLASTSPESTTTSSLNSHLHSAAEQARQHSPECQRSALP